MGTLNTHRGTELNWAADKNSDNPYTITCRENAENGPLFNLTPFVFTLDIFSDWGTTAVKTLSEGSGLTNGGAAGTIAIDLTKALASIKLSRPEYKYRIKYVVDGKTFTMFYGTLSLSPESASSPPSTSLSATINLNGTQVSAAITLGGTAFASQAEVLAGTNDAKAISPLTLRNSSLNKGIFNVDDFGAVANSDGTTGNGTDNTIALNAAIAAAIAGGGGIVRLGEGIYRFITPLATITGNNIVIEGMGMGVSTLFCDNITTNLPGIFNTGANTHYRNFTFKGRKTFLSAAVGINMRGNSSTIYRVEVTQSNNFGIYANSGTDQSITNCYVHDSRADGIHVNFSSRVNIQNNIVYNCADDGIGIGFEGPADNINVSGNIIYQTSAGIAVMGYSTVGVSPDVNNITINGNTIHQTWLAGVLLHMTQGSLKGVTISGNTMNRTGGWSSTVGVEMRGTGMPGGVVIYANTGVTTRTLTDVTITGNTITDTKNSFVYVGTNQGITIGIIRNVKISANNFNGTLAGTGAVASWHTGAQQTIANPGNYFGIMVANATGNIDISNNSIRGAWQGGVFVFSTVTGFISIRNNSDVGSNTGGGIWITNISFQTGGTTPTTTVALIGNTAIEPVNAYAIAVSGFSSGALILDFNCPQDIRNLQTGTSYTVLDRDATKIIALTNTAARSITMPSAAQFPDGKIFYVKDEAGTASIGNITMTRAGTDTIDGATTSVINTDFGSRGFYSNRVSKWFSV